MNLYIIKIFGIILVTMCCLIATYTDVKYQIIPNKLTFTTIILGISLVSIYFSLVGHFNLFYYISICAVFVFSYILWKLGVWAGGDVKLFTAISTLLIPDFMNILPSYVINGISLPFNIFSLRVPAFYVMFNSILSIIPVVLIYVSIIIMKDKPNLKEKFIQSFNFKDVLLTVNSLIISYMIISELNVYHTLIKIIFLLILSYVMSKILNYKIILIISTILVISQQILTANLIFYLTEFIIITVLITVKNIYHKSIIQDALTQNIDMNLLEEGMILQYPLYYKNQQYYFDKSNWYDFKDKGELICSNNACGLTNVEIKKLKKVYVNSTISIKKGLSFAPFILAGLIITLLLGNTYQLSIYLVGLI